MARTGAVLLVVITLTAVAVPLTSGLVLSASPPMARAAPRTQLTCDRFNNEATAVIVRRRDAVLGPLVLIGARQTPGRPPDAFDRQGYKIPVTLSEGVRATLSVPAAQRGRVGLVYSLASQDAVQTSGLRGADRAVEFVACVGATEASLRWLALPAIRDRLHARPDVGGARRCRWGHHPLAQRAGRRGRVPKRRRAGQTASE